MTEVGGLRTRNRDSFSVLHEASSPLPSLEKKLRDGRKDTTYGRQYGDDLGLTATPPRLATGKAETVRVQHQLMYFHFHLLSPNWLICSSYTVAMSPEKGIPCVNRACCSVVALHDALRCICWADWCPTTLLIHTSNVICPYEFAARLLELRTAFNAQCQPCPPNRPRPYLFSCFLHLRC
jgi:hypothetical protein